jgi:N utilization substance protein B
VNAVETDREPATRRHGRSPGRVLALQYLYAWEQNHYQDDGCLVPDELLSEAADEAATFARALFAGCLAQRVPIDAAVDARLENWTIHRLAVADRAILRLGAYEIIFCPETPPKVAINEGIELAKQFGSEAKTAKLVNGVLDRIAREHRAGEVGRRAPTSPTGASPAGASPAGRVANE